MGTVIIQFKTDPEDKSIWHYMRIIKYSNRLLKQKKNKKKKKKKKKKNNTHTQKKTTHTLKTTTTTATKKTTTTNKQTKNKSTPEDKKIVTIYGNRKHSNQFLTRKTFKHHMATATIQISSWQEYLLTPYRTVNWRENGNSEYSNQLIKRKFSNTVWEQWTFKSTPEENIFYTHKGTTNIQNSLWNHSIYR